MDSIYKTVNSLKSSLAIVKEYLSIDNVLIIIFMFVGIYLLIKLFIEFANYKLLRNRFRRNRKKRPLVLKLLKILSKNKLSSKLIKSITRKICIYNDKSLEKNNEYSVIVLFILFILAILSAKLIIPETIVVWYMFIFYIFLSLCFFLLLIDFFGMIAKARFINQLPKTYKALNSRLNNTQDILEAIELSLNDFDKAVKREMKRIYISLTKNTKEKADITMNEIENIYDNYYFTYLLTLIKQAHYKKVSEELLVQFEETTDEILHEIENQRDLAFMSRMFIGLGLTFPVWMKLSEIFNLKALGSSSLDYYNSPIGIMLKISVLLGVAIYIFILVALEKNI